MSVVGIDFGSLHSKIGVARHRGIDIITNEVSNRATPSLVSFGPKQRALGESAKTQEISNFRNTAGSLKRLIGRTLNDVEIQHVEKKFTHVNLVDVDGSVGVQVSHLGEPTTFSATQLVGMYLGRLRDIAAKELKIGVSDVVIAIPGWYTDVQRRALLSASTIAGLNPLRLIPDHTAVAFGYGITKADLPDVENPRHVVFVDIGHSSMSVAVVAFSKGQLTVKSTAYDTHLGGRDIDYALVQHFAEEFKAKYRIDVLSNPKATFRLYAAAEKLKKVLSANAEAPLNVESIMNDIDASSKLTRDQYEQLIADVLDRIPGPLQRALDESGLTIEQVDAIELVGGSTRVPAVRAKIQAVYPGKSLSTTLNQDEACARGTTFACATLSPVFRVRDFAIHDIAVYPIKVRWEKTPTDEEEDTELVVFPRGNGIPSTKVLTFYRKAPFDIEAVYADPSALPGTDVGPSPTGDFSTVRVKARLNLHGILSFEAVYTEEVEEKEEMQKKKVVKKNPVAYVTGYGGLDSSVLTMYSNDKLVQDTEERKNALEEYIYDMRSKLDDRYAPFVQSLEKEALLAELSKDEDWLYSEEGEDATKSAYVTRIDAAKKLGDPITTRWREAEERPKAAAQLRETINQYILQATSTEERFAHIDEKDKQSIVEKAVTIQKWLEDQSVRQSERPKNVDPVLTAIEISKKRDEVIYFATPILTRPKPKPPKIDGADTPRSGAETPNPPSKGDTETKTEEGQVPPEMDVD
ncbi:heat shock protein 70 family [Multifurca ochricompacta]|uniref:Heat shock protein 70 family n=1 Tax=Multifurca ochricompacta TaxID=376703 RepID=A0AAD4M8M0_9AGAM|nr:heat shock protein 70 family [Multifurca ochricompacta]